MIGTHDHWIPLRRSNQLSYQATSSTRTQSQLCTATPISSFVKCHISFPLLPSSVATFVLIEVLLRKSHECSGMSWYIWHSSLKDSSKYLQKVDLSGIWTQDHLIRFPRTKQLSYQAMSSTRNQSQLLKATLTSSFVKCRISFRLLPSSVGTFILIAVFLM